MSQSTAVASRGCHKCGQLGHWARDCTGVPSQDRPVEQETQGDVGAESTAERATTVGSSRKRPKLSYEALKESKGIPDVYNNFPSLMKATFQGRGHEISDTRKMLELYKRWGDRVFPSAGPNHTFDTFIADVEKMSTSSIVKSDLHGMRENVLNVAVKVSKIEEDTAISDGEQAAQDDDDELLQLAMEEYPETNDATERPVVREETDPQALASVAEPEELDDQALLDLLFEE
ncbi:hypothetical protein M9434_003371 [Picochlorum sp. BPE23]|nr:hypothetical protein M9434_003371 [Picochlorum sp. BPE23]